MGVTGGRDQKSGSRVRGTEPGAVERFFQPTGPSDEELQMELSEAP